MPMSDTNIYVCFLYQHDVSSEISFIFGNENIFLRDYQSLVYFITKKKIF